jgi:uncharacterized protein
LDTGIPVLTNKAVRWVKDGQPFWVTGTDSIIAFPLPHGDFRGMDDLPGTLAQVTGTAPINHLAHEPDIYQRMPERVSLTLSGHTWRAGAAHRAAARDQPFGTGLALQDGMCAEDSHR